MVGRGMKYRRLPYCRILRIGGKKTKDELLFQDTSREEKRMTLNFRSARFVA